MTMKTTKVLTSGVLTALCMVLGCGRGEDRALHGAQVELVAGKGSSQSFALGAAGARAESRVDRQVAADGSEVLHGTTEVSLDGAAHPEVVTEDAEIDASGRLVRATSELRSGAHGLRL